MTTTIMYCPFYFIVITCIYNIFISIHHWSQLIMLVRNAITLLPYRRTQQTKWQMRWWLYVNMIRGARMYLRNTSRTTPRMRWDVGENAVASYKQTENVSTAHVCGQHFLLPCPNALLVCPTGRTIWIRLAAVSYRGKKVRTVVSLVVRSVNKSRDAQNCAQNEPEYAICIFTTRLHFKALGLLLCDLKCQIRHTLQGLWRWPLWRYRSPQDVSAGHGRCHGDNPWKFRNNVIV